MKTIENVQVFAIGTWNSRTFTSADLDEMLRSFHELKLDGRLPAKFGHSDDTTQPAQGWITNLRRSGDKLVADLTNVPDTTFQAIKQGRWRHVSAEILADVVAPNGARYPYVLDGLALLGAARPAVGVLEGLHKLVAAALPGLAWKQRLSFQFESNHTSGDITSMTDETLRNENARLVRELISLKFSSAIREGKILPAAQAQFTRRYKSGDATVQDADEWITTSPRPPENVTRGRPTSGAEGGTFMGAQPLGRTFSDPGAEVVHRVKLVQDEARKAGQTLSYRGAAKLVFERQDPESKQLLQEYLRLHSPDC